MTEFNTIGIFGNLEDAAVTEVVDRITVILDSNAITHRQYYVTILDDDKNRGVDDDELDLAIIVGGDGTFMNVARLRAGCKAPVLGINVGRRGFLSDVAVREIEESMQLALDGQYSIETRMVLVAKTTLSGSRTKSFSALNDIVVHKSNYGRLIDFEISVDGNFMTNLRADGVIVATPTGSTAYALSAGGSVLYPTLPAMELVPLNPHTLTHRPIVLSDDSSIDIQLVDVAPTNASLVVDGHVRAEFAGNERIVVQRDRHTVDFIRITGHTFYNALRQKLGLGV
ncbi:MAG: NAD(+)/NADH kinase [Acidiferrobacterales bacterium]|nr:NAD(+)/NADH kinase [Acidiferrobacterales bacterium]